MAPRQPTVEIHGFPKNAWLPWVLGSQPVKFIEFLKKPMVLGWTVEISVFPYFQIFAQISGSLRFGGSVSAFGPPGGQSLRAGRQDKPGYALRRCRAGMDGLGGSWVVLRANVSSWLYYPELGFAQS